MFKGESNPENRMLWKFSKALLSSPLALAIAVASPARNSESEGYLLANFRSRDGATVLRDLAPASIVNPRFVKPLFSPRSSFVGRVKGELKTVAYWESSSAKSSRSPGSIDYL